MTQTIRFKKLRPDAVTPTKANAGDAGWDLTAVGDVVLECGKSYLEYGTGIAVEIPEGYVGLVFPRSSISRHKNIALTNSVGVIDSGYRGEIMARFRVYNNDSKGGYQSGDRIGQLVIVPIWSGELVEADELSETERGEGGFGSSGK